MYINDDVQPNTVIGGAFGNEFEINIILQKKDDPM